MKIMHNPTRLAKAHSGFSLLELMVAATLGLIVIMAATQIFRGAMAATFSVTQRAETQQNMRAGIEMMTKDLSMAGAGLPTGGLQLPANPSLIACNQAGTCYVPGAVYPNGNFMTGIVPGFNRGVQGGAVIVSAPAAVNDSVTSAYCDYNFPLSNFSFAFPNGNQANVGPAAVITPGLPTNILANGGLNVGDLMLFIVATPGNGTGNQGTSSAQTAVAVGEITGIPNNTQINFAGADALNFNQNGPNSLANVALTYVAGSTLTACRLNVVTYFLQVPAAGGTVQTPRLMRQVNGLNAVPVADNIINLQFTYDVINGNTNTVTANQANPVGAGLSSALIQKVNIVLMGQSLLSGGKRYQSQFLASSVSARNMSFCNSLSASTTACN